MATIKIEGMSCGGCASAVKDALSRVDCVSNVEIDLEKCEATFVEEGSVDPNALRSAVERAGYRIG
jgi:copper chaperone CopZ